MKLNSLYTTFQGEANPFGIGHPAIFLRLQGCHLRCYKRTMGILCDTPEGLVKPKEHDEVMEIVNKTITLSKKTGVKVVTLTGGDPLWNSEEDLWKLFYELTIAGLSVCVETSGTISWLPYSNKFSSLYWVLDYKLASAGVKNADALFLDADHLNDLSADDYIKFVVADEFDMVECITAIKRIQDKTSAKICVGAFWGGKLSTFEIFERLKSENLLARTIINAQLHKLVIAPNTNVKIPKEV